MPSPCFSKLMSKTPLDSSSLHQHSTDHWVPKYVLSPQSSAQTCKYHRRTARSPEEASRKGGQVFLRQGLSTRRHPFQASSEFCQCRHGLASAYLPSNRKDRTKSMTRSVSTRGRERSRGFIVKAPRQSSRSCFTKKWAPRPQTAVVAKEEHNQQQQQQPLEACFNTLYL